MQSEETIEFLRAILPDKGLYVAWVKKSSGASFNTVYDAIEPMAAAILAADAKGHDAYHACGTYLHREGVWNAKKEKFEIRAQTNVWGARALWVDLDAGNDGDKPKPYPDARTAAGAVMDFCRSANLPPALLVGSGYGVHAYWPFETSLNPADWYQLASGLKALAAQRGLIVDPTCTTDTARVLRTPGTRNHKYSSAVPVVAGPLVGPYKLSDFVHLLALSSAAPLPVARADKAPVEVSALTAAITTGVYDPLYAEHVADGCAQVGQLRNNNTRYGPILEPVWYAALGVLAWCADGHTKAHAWSSVHPNYSQTETDDRLTRAKHLSGATTCAKFQSLNPAGCSSCPVRGKIKSPISLGHPTSRLAVQGHTSAFSATSQAAVSPSPSILSSPTTPFSAVTSKAAVSPSPLTDALRAQLYAEPLPPLRLPWKWSRFRQLVMEIEKDGEESEILICNYPLFLEGVQIGEVGEGAFSYHFKQFLPHAGWINVVIPAEQLMGPGGIPKLFGKGVVIHDTRAFSAYVRGAVDAYNAENQLRTRYDQFGWKNNDTGFLCGARLYGATATQDALGNDEVKERSAWLRPKPGGSLAAWSAAANALFQSGCEVQAFALLCSFAAPLMRFHTIAEGGAIVALHSRGSAKGKSTALAAVSSVWGDKKGLEITNVDTNVSKGITLGVLGNLPIVYDELQDQDPEVIRNFVRVFTNGRDRMRGTTQGTIRHTQASWQTILVSASNASLTDTLYHSSGIDALAFRVIELPVTLPPNVDTTKGDGLQKQLEQNCGYAGDNYLQYLLQPETLNWARQALATWTAELWAKTGLSAEHRFRIRCLGSVAVAAALVNKLGLLTFDPQRIMDWATSRVVRMRHDAPVTGHDADMSTTALAAYLSEHIGDTLVMPREYRSGDRIMLPLLVPARKLLVRFEKANGRLLLSSAPLRAWLLRKEISYRAFMEDLVGEQIVLAAERKATLAAGTDLPGGQLPCVEINAHHPALAGVLTNVTKLEDVRRVGLASVAKP